MLHTRRGSIPRENAFEILDTCSGRRRLENFKEIRTGCLLLLRSAHENIDAVFISIDTRLLAQLVTLFIDPQIL